jgi:O-glycosyl hydrolase
MRAYVTVLLSLLYLGCQNNPAIAQASSSCKVCGDQQRACMKNYAGPTCKTEYRMCMKSCQNK